MNHADFLVWMLLYPLMSKLEGFVQSKYRPYKDKEFSDGVYGMAALIHLSVWGFVGYKLW